MKKNTRYSVTLSHENIASITAALTVIAHTAAEEDEFAAFVTAMDALKAISETIEEVK